MDRLIVIRRANAHVVAALLTVGSAVAAPQTVLAASGGSGLGGSPAPTQTENATNSSSSPTGAVQQGNVTVSSTGNGITISTHASAMLFKGLQLSGTIPSSDAGSVVEVERLGRETGWAWAPTAHGTAQSDGSFTAFWPANHIGRFQIRAVIEGRGGTSARAGTPSSPVTVIVYRPSIATWYGPGSYGTKTACGVTLRKTTFGVANRTLRCGMKVAVYYHGRTMVVPVIDRGPYANHADWDLTAAAAKALGTYTAGVATIGAVSLPTQ
jgi:peptidoglycan lytic transglycosylase